MNKNIKYSLYASIVYVLAIMYIVQGEVITSNGRACIVAGLAGMLIIVNGFIELNKLDN